MRLMGIASAIMTVTICILGTQRILLGQAAGDGQVIPAVLTQSSAMPGLLRRSSYGRRHLPAFPNKDVVDSMNAQSRRDDINALLKKLIPVPTNEDGRVSIAGPSLETQQHVHDELLTIAGETPESRLAVVEGLLQVLEDADSRQESPKAYRWTTAVVVLGELGATEAIESLVRNLDQTGENGMVSSRNYRPVAQAIAKIGKPGIPHLIEALSNGKPDIRREAASTLTRIGHPASGKLKFALHYGDAKTRGGAALALAWIGGTEAKTAIEHAIASEKDREALKEMKDALRERRRLWGN